MWPDHTFMDAVQELAVPIMGTDAMAPWLYSTLRFMRARSVLEVGMGYTTPFIARALRDNADAFRAEREAVRAKARPYLAELDALDPAASVATAPEGRGLAAIYGAKASELAERRTRWMFADPAALLDPGYYLEEPTPCLTCVDNLGTTSSSASRVLKVLESMGLRDQVHKHRVDFWALDPASFDPSVLPFDLMWLDLPVSARQVMSLLRGRHWELLNPDGGLLIIHDMLTHEGGQMLVREFFKVEQQKRFGEFEFVGLIEPHRVVQNSFVMVRKLTGHVDRQIEAAFTAPGESSFESGARALVQQID